MNGEWTALAAVENRPPFVLNPPHAAKSDQLAVNATGRSQDVCRSDDRSPLRKMILR
jgi:hypothetical protein